MSFTHAQALAPPGHVDAVLSRSADLRGAAPPGPCGQRASTSHTGAPAAPQPGCLPDRGPGVPAPARSPTRHPTHWTTHFLEGRAMPPASW